MKIKFSLSLFVVAICLGFSFLRTSAQPSVTCFATHDNGTTVYSSTDMSAVQGAVNQASNGGTVKIAGTCTGITPSQTMGISLGRSITLQGGYSSSDWTTSDPVNQPTVLDADREGSVVEVSSSASTRSYVFENLTITNGLTNYGGGIFFDRFITRTQPYKAIVRNVNLIKNSADTQGGAIYGDNIELVMEDSQVIDNSSPAAGGLSLSCGANVSYTCAESRIENTIIKDNFAVYFGSGVYINVGEYQLRDVTISTNELVFSGIGAGVYNNGGKISLLSSVVEDNFIGSGGSGGRGAGIYNRAGDIFISGTSFLNNQLSTDASVGNEGGAIYNGRDISITDSLFDGNIASKGGALYSKGGTILFVNHSEFVNNIAGRNGGAIYNEGELEIINTTIDNNQADFLGGGIYNTNSIDGVAVIRRSTISNNSVSNSISGGGGVYNQAEISIINSTVSGNSAESPTLRNTTLSESEIQDLLATGGGGGLLNKYIANLISVTFANNTAEEVGGYQFGGGIHNTDIGQLSMVNVLSADNIGGDCIQRATLISDITNLVEDGGCNAIFTGDPLLLPLADNGGPTKTHGFDTNSLALDNGFLPPTQNDQRNVTRPQGNGPDIGAYELSLVPLAVDLSHQTTSSNAPIITALLLVSAVSMTALSLSQHRKS